MRNIVSKCFYYLKGHSQTETSLWSVRRFEEMNSISHILSFRSSMNFVCTCFAGESCLNKILFKPRFQPNISQLWQIIYVLSVDIALLLGTRYITTRDPSSLSRLSVTLGNYKYAQNDFILL